MLSSYCKKTSKSLSKSHGKDLIARGGFDEVAIMRMVKTFTYFAGPVQPIFTTVSALRQKQTNKNEQNNANKQKTTKVSIATKPLKNIFLGNFTHTEGATVFCSSYEQYIIN